MLILSRRVGESVVIVDPPIRITLLEMRGGSVRIGFEADRAIIIHREENLPDDPTAREETA